MNASMLKIKKEPDTSANPTADAPRWAVQRGRCGTPAPVPTYDVEWPEITYGAPIEFISVLESRQPDILATLLQPRGLAAYSPQRPETSRFAYDRGLEKFAGLDMRFPLDESFLLPTDSKNTADIGSRAIRTPRIEDFFAHLKSIREARIPSRWEEDGCAQPTDACRERSAEILHDLYVNLQMLPARIGASRVGGIMLVYRNPQADLELEIEVDNDLDVVGVLATRSDVLNSAELADTNEWREIARELKRRGTNAPAAARLQR